MKKKTAIRLLAASWLIAPTLLSTQSAFATTSRTQTSSSSLIAERPTFTTESSTSDSTVSSSSTDSSDSTQESTEESSEAATRTLTIARNLRGKIKLRIVDEEEEEADIKTREYTEEDFLEISKSGKVKDLEEGTKVTYMITPAANERLVSVKIEGAQEIDYTKQMFTVGVTDLTITGKFESTTSPSEPSTPEEETTDSSQPTPVTPEVPDNGNSGNSGNSGNNNGNNNGNSNTGNTTNPSRPPSSSNNNGNSNTNGSTGSTNNTGSSSNQTANTNRPSTPDRIENPSSESSDFVVKTPIEAVLPTNTTSIQQALVKEAYKHLGKPYVWGAKGPATFDCSGLTYFIYKQVTGYSIGGWTGEQQYAGTKIPVDQAQPGDLVFWGPSTGITHHVGIYIGNGNYIHAPQPGDHVRITSLKAYTPNFALRVNLAGLPRATGSLASSPILDGLNETFHFTQNQTTDQFLEKIAEDAREIGQEEDIYASVMMAQAILESGSGNSLLSRSPNYNLFGIKGAYKGSSVSFNTLEQTSAGQNYQIRAAFRKYPSYKESLEDYADLIKNGLSHNSDFYKPTWKSETKDFREATKYLEGRYATDRQYSRKLNAIIEAYDLTQFDEPKEQEKNEEETNEQSDSFVVPIRWQRPSPTFSRMNISLFNQRNPSLLYLSELRFASFWDLWHHFSVREIPQKLSVTVRETDQPLASRLNLDRVFRMKQFLR
ncbi:C40 family peptidase [Enterococcus sp. DIV1298c]|uniref:NlpC/P60 domain-containing protein n=1 Tax=Candidatus Enterococcus mangumiae TaxID=2230878 RepID=A0ABZ2SWM9_9ENTE|nr:MULTISPECIES: glucosaminidase domain-containing protein [unclassified Enterococcus]MBO0462465.1 C40 family peptidase [Enterococcus sp. DIV1298c]MBO0490688.1 C40 family peptidase [Enterococcus sp. DIV1094]